MMEHCIVKMKMDIFGSGEKVPRSVKVGRSLSRRPQRPDVGRFKYDVEVAADNTTVFTRIERF